MVWGMPSSTLSYSPLEALLLFIYLRNYGISAEVFDKISTDLLSNPQIKGTTGFDANRLNPNALCDYFLKLWKEELRYEGRTALENDGANGTTPGSPRKRKAPSPTLPTVQDAANNLQLLPKVILRLYGRYREQTVLEIREYEDKHDKLQQEIKDIQRGDWDTKLQKGLQDTSQRQIQTIDAAHKHLQNRANGNLKAPISHPRPVGNLLRPPVDRKEPINRSPSPNSTTIELPKTVPRKNVPMPMPVPHQHHQQLQHQQQQHSQHHYQHPQQQQQQQQPHPQHIANHPHQQQLPPGYRTPSATPQPPHHPRPINPLPPQSAGQVYHSHPPNYASPSVSTLNHPTLAQFHGPPGFHPSPGGPNSPYGPPRLATPHHPVAPFPAQRAGIVDQSPVVPQVYTPVAASTPVQPPRSATHTPAPTSLIIPRTPQTVVPHPVTELVDSVSKLLKTYQTPTSNSSIKTIWKPQFYNGHHKEPVRGDISPISVRSQSDAEPEVKPRTRKGRSNIKESAELAPPSTKSGRSTARKARGVSTASSAIDSSGRGRTRSQSVVSQVSQDRPLKPEPSTPNDAMDVLMIDDTPMPAPSAITRRATRGKRKRSATPASDSGEVEPSNLAVVTQAYPQPIERSEVLAVRNFSRMSNTVMNEITSHKYASVFSKPVNNREAEGYTSIIRRPTDLKTIRTSIITGGRAVNASSIDPAASSAMIPWSEDLVPPKAIVNSAQLERELMRMFANAVMFNSGEGEVVADAREMFESAEASLVNFRSAEKTAEASAALRRRGESEASEEDKDTSLLVISKRRKA